ncbi:TIGR03085 family metal-binding protein [Pengzhenrongella sicca]|uniref:TIGR03085 family protein n=1 Tax=Pengzhenrongella sicca TaxID=2819238 RepID=A0A8A4ZHB2_9MICO|nr:TIGR03085 family metal-binding protein [Pengzhenrongella sicca]QTE30781.1 TIGR03085 family protein [Pengzhenrongella sicca]
MSWHEHERSALVQALTEASPAAPTLCEGWQARHLAAHVVLRENAPLVAAGVAVPLLSGRTERAIGALADSAVEPAGYADLIARVAAGPPRWQPMSWAGDAGNLLEFFVHTEDVRRGAGAAGPRTLDPALTAELWHQLVRTAALMYRGARVGVVLVVPGGPRREVRRPRGRAGTVVVRGEVGEVILHAFGRTAAARVHVLGDPVDVTALAEATAS